MTKIFSKGDISHTRGDTAFIRLSLTNNGEPYAADGDTFTLTIKRNVHDDEYVLQKMFAVPRILLQPKDTAGLDAGTYVYDIQIQTQAGVVQTIGPHKFHLLADVTR